MTAVIAQESIKVVVGFYNKEERTKLLSYPTGQKIAEIVRDGMAVPIPEFLTYFLFHQKRPGMPGYNSYREIARDIGRARSILGDFLNFNGHSINWPAQAKHQLPYVTEYVGESIGLAVVNRIHGLTEADWAKIQEIRGPHAPRVFDYEHLAADGKVIVEVETKGSCVDDNASLCDAIYSHKANIEGKKKQIAEREAKAGGPAHPRIRYGTITAIASRPDSIAKCLLVDPPPREVEFSPRNFRLLNRMRFLRDWISFISPRSQLASALATRVTDLENIADPYNLDGVPLRKGNGEPFSFEIFNPFTRRHSSFLASKSRVTDGPAGGVILQLSNKELLLLGIREQLLSIVSEQTFEAVTNYRAEVGSLVKTVKCTFSSGRFKELILPPSVVNSVQRNAGYVWFNLQGPLHYSQEGLVFGILSLPQN